jgi:hypothetical protein
MNVILISNWEIFGIIAWTSGVAIALGVFITLYARLRREQRGKTKRDANQTDRQNHVP